MSYHKVLEKQIKKLLPGTCLEDEKMQRFLTTVSNSYDTFEKDKKLSEHAFSVSEKEYQEVTLSLRRQNEIMNQSILQLKDAVHSLAPDGMLDLKDNDGDLIDIIGYLQQQIIKTKELEAELISAKEFAEKAANAKSDFLSVMSHEIRTPLNAIIGYIHLLTQEDPLPSQLDFLRILQISADNLLSLINDVLDFGKIEEGKIVFSEKDVDIRKLVMNIKMANLIRAEEKGNTLKVMFDEDIPLFIKADEVRLTQVLNNLISNAIKFTKQGNIVIEVQQESKTADEIEIYFAVKDSGIGIPEDKQQLIFERFTQENSEITRQYGGSGLGLSIIRKLLLLQNSDIHVESTIGKGSKFFFSLMFKKSSASYKEEAKATNGADKNLHGLRVLLAEDVEFNVLLAEKMLSNWNAKTTVAENGSVAVDLMRNNEFDIVLMDIQMPVMDGLTASKAIRTFNTHTPIIALTASTSSFIQDQVSLSGMDDYLSKPLNPGYLYSTLLKYAEDKEQQLEGE